MIDAAFLRRRRRRTRLRLVARAVGASMKDLKAWEHGTMQPDVETLRRLAAYYAVPLAAFVHAS